ncbi:MAG: glycosyltransferase family 4 protein [Synergistaceae bacterium]|nr:glycosyltransferase family 4 protein [Synergistaceae bacterium]
MKKILYVTSKHPSSSDSRDGGDSTVFEMIRALGSCCQLDILCFRECDCEVKIPFVNKIFSVNMDFANYAFHSANHGEKFLIRLDQAAISAREIARIAPAYDIIMIQHCMFALRLAEFAPDVFERIILLPMFTGVEYIKARDAVPSSYIEAEKQALSKIAKFITPSYAEQKILIDDYGISAQKIAVIPRSVNNIEFTQRKHCRKNLPLIYIASIRRQKAHIEAMELFKLVKKSVPARLHCVGTIQDKNLFDECIDFLTKNSLMNDVIFHRTLKPTDLNHLLSECDVNISVSLWETFGRGIFEGMAAGLPTVALRRILSVLDFSEECRPLIADSIDDMANKIFMLYADKNLFCSESSKGRFVRDHLSFDRIGTILRDVILSD